MSDDTQEIVRRPRRTLAQIKIPGDTLIPREDFAHDVIGVCERTAAPERVNDSGTPGVMRLVSKRI
jgi:hypothetical protein